MKKSKKFLAALLSVVSAAGMANMATAMHSRSAIGDDYSWARQPRRSEWGTSSTSSTIASRRPEPRARLCPRDLRSVNREDIVEYILPMCFRYLVASFNAYTTACEPQKYAASILHYCLSQASLYCQHEHMLGSGLGAFTKSFLDVHNIFRMPSPIQDAAIKFMNDNNYPCAVFMCMRPLCTKPDYNEVSGILKEAVCNSEVPEFYWRARREEMSKVHSEIEIPFKYRARFYTLAYQYLR